MVSGRRQRFAMPRHVEGNNSVFTVDFLIIEQVPKLARVRTGRVKADERDAAACFLKIYSVRAIINVEVEVSTHCGFDLSCHGSFLTMFPVAFLGPL